MTEQAPPRLVEVGDVLRLSESDYDFGVEPLVLRVTGVFETYRLNDEEWLNVRGRPVLGPGDDGPERHALVRIAALPAARATPATEP